MKKYKEHGLAILILILVGIIGIIYVNNSARNIVFMDYWRNIVRLIPDVMNRECNFFTFWQDAFGQRNFLQLLLVAFNIRFTHLNCLWESYAGLLLIVCSTILVYAVWTRINSRNTLDQKALLKQIAFFPIILMLFNLNQWEILSLEFSFSFMLRIFSFLLIFFLIDKAIINGQWNTRYFLGYGILAGFIIDFLSQLYFPAMVFSVILSFFLAFVLNFGQTKQKLLSFLSFFIPVIISIFLYFEGVSSADMGGGLVFFKGMLQNGTFFTGIFYMLASSLLPQTFLESITSTQIMMIGITLFIILLFALVLYFKFHMYEWTYFPVMLITYGGISIPIIIYGRAGIFDMFYLTSSRYACETTLIWVGCTFIFSYVILRRPHKFFKISAAISGIILVFLVIYADITELKIAPFRGVYKDNLLETIAETDITELDETTLSLFQASPELVREGIEMMQAFQLNIYYISE